MQDVKNAEAWRKYQFHTGDIDSASDQLKPFSAAELALVIVPDGWNKSEALAELAAKELVDGSPFDSPQPAISFDGWAFMFTGNFDYGTSS